MVKPGASPSFFVCVTVHTPEAGPFPVAGSDYGFVVGWATTGHTAAPVPITAVGPGAEFLTGAFENTDVFHALVAAMDLAPVEAAAVRD